MFGAAAMSLSSFCVVSNALRLNRIKVRNTQKDKADKNTLTTLDISAIQNMLNKGDKKMTKTINIEGMMCAHCQARVKGALESLDAVTSADVSYEKANAVVTLKEEISDETLIKTVTDAGYDVKGVE